MKLNLFDETRLLICELMLKMILYIGQYMNTVFLKNFDEYLERL